MRLRNWATRALLAFALLGTCVPAVAQKPKEPPVVSVDVVGLCAPTVEANRRAQLTNAGDAGLWFHMEVARCMLERLTLLPSYVERLGLLEQRLSLSDERTMLLREQVTLAEAGEARATGALTAAQRGKREAEEARDAWHRHPALWFTVGVVATGALVTITAYSISSVR